MYTEEAGNYTTVRCIEGQIPPLKKDPEAVLCPPILPVIWVLWKFSMKLGLHQNGHLWLTRCSQVQLKLHWWLESHLTHGFWLGRWPGPICPEGKPICCPWACASLLAVQYKCRGSGKETQYKWPSSGKETQASYLLWRWWWWQHFLFIF